MIHWRLLPVALLALGLAACGGDGEADRADTGNGGPKAAAEESGRDGPFSESPSEAAEVSQETSENSRELWAMIQEDHSELTDEQQRTLQSCAAIRIRDQGVSMEESLRQCRDEMEETLQEEEEDEEQEEEGDGED